MRPILLAFSALLAACSAAPGTPDLPPDAGTAAAPDAGTSDTPDAGVLAAPDTAPGRALAWIVDTLNGHPASLTADDLAAHFAASFLDAVPAGQVRALFVQLADAQPWRLAALEPGATATRLVADLADAHGRYQRVSIAVESADSDLMTGLFLAPAPDADPTLTWAALDERLAATAPRARLLAAELTGGACVPVHAREPEAVSPLGSEFKLYVLATLGAQVAAGTRHWTDPLAIRDEWKSLPSGTWQTQRAGTTHTLQEFAAQMISVSDNTATDHLLHAVGRENVEAMLAEAGHHAPALDVPFPSTRELFVLKLALGDADRGRYLAADAAGRRHYLDDVYASVDLAATQAAAAHWTTPLFIDELEWFASADDVCRAFAKLKDLADAPGGKPIYDVLAKNPGMPVDTRVFPYVGYKGGSEPGVLTLSWLLRRRDQRWFVVSTAFSDPAAPVDEAAAEYLALAATVLVGR